MFIEWWWLDNIVDRNHSMFHLTLSPLLHIWKYGTNSLSCWHKISLYWVNLRPARVKVAMPLFKSTSTLNSAPSFNPTPVDVVLCFPLFHSICDHSSHSSTLHYLGWRSIVAVSEWFDQPLRWLSTHPLWCWCGYTG